MYERRKKYERCEFDKDGTVPVLFICSGRSGSSNTWMTLSRLVGGERSEALETMGSSSKDVERMMQVIGTERAGRWFIREHMCEISRYWCKSGIAGFQFH